MKWYERKGLRWLAFFRIELDRKTDLVALAAFFLSIGGILYQVYLITRGAEVVQFPPEQIAFYAEKSGNVDYVNAGAAMSYVNKGKGDKSAVVKMERLSFELGGKSYELKWQNFVEYSSQGNQQKVENPKPAVPAIIKSGEAITHETHFAPRSVPVENGSVSVIYKNFLRWDQFLSELEKLDKVNVRIISEFYDMKDKEINVYVRITPVAINSLKTNRWDAISCWPITNQSKPNSRQRAFCFFGR